MGSSVSAQKQGNIIPVQKQGEKQGASLSAQKQVSSSELDKQKAIFNEENKNKGCVGSIWDGVKRSIGSSEHIEDGTERAWYNPKKLWSKVIDYDKSSESVEKELAKQPKTPQQIDKQIKAIQNFKSSQENGVNTIADLTAAGAAVITVAGVTAATGGIGLPGAIAAGATTGAAAKIAVKGGNTIDTNKHYTLKDGICDGVTGAVDGASAIVAGAVGSKVSEFAGSRISSTIGVKTISEASTGATTGSMMGFSSGAVETLKNGGTVSQALTNGAKTGAAGLAAGAVLGGAFGAASGSIEKINGIKSDVKTGIELSKQDMQNEATVDNGLSNEITKQIKNLKDNPIETIQTGLEKGKKIAESENVINYKNKLDEKLTEKFSDFKFIEKIAMSPDANQQELFEMTSPIGVRKFLQLLSSDEKLMAKLPPDLAEMVTKLRSCGVPTRATINPDGSVDLVAAQKFVDQLYGPDKYNVDNLLGVGTVGEVLRATTKKGEEVVIKTVKDGVTPEVLEQEKGAFLDAAKAVYGDTPKGDYYNRFITNMYDSWNKELDMGLEAQSAKDLAAAGSYYKVAQARELGYLPSEPTRAVSAVFEKAPGVSLDKLIEMGKNYQKNPAGFAEKYANIIKENPWAGNPDKWIQGTSRRIFINSRQTNNEWKYNT